MVLRKWVLNAHICGIHFYSSPHLLIDCHEDRMMREDVFLRVEGGWLFEPSRTEGWPQIPLKGGPLEDLAAVSVKLRPHAISRAELGSVRSDLRLTFSNGAALYVSGSHPEFESWELQYPGGNLVNLAGGDLAIFDSTV